MIGTATVGTRRRVAALRGGERPPRWLSIVEDWADVLALPIDADVVAGTAPACLLVVGTVATLVAGPAGVIACIGALAAASALAARTAPARRAAAIDRQLPVLLESVARHVRAGGSLAQALASAQPDSGGELDRSWRRLNAAVPAAGVVAALDHWSSDSTDGPAGSEAPRASVRLAGAALALAAETGGSSARAIDGVASSLRARLAVADEVRALSSQARASAAVIASAPILFGVAAAGTDERTSAFVATPAGACILVAGLALDGLGAWWMARLCRSPETRA